MPVTRRQREILDFIAGQLDAKGYAPSFEEIAHQFGFHSLATVHEHLTNLERKGYIRRAHNESRAIEIIPPKGQTGATELPLLGLVAAGQPIAQRSFASQNPQHGSSLAPGEVRGQESQSQRRSGVPPLRMR